MRALRQGGKYEQGSDDNHKPRAADLAPHFIRIGRHIPSHVCLASSGILSCRIHVQSGSANVETVLDTCLPCEISWSKKEASRPHNFSASELVLHASVSRTKVLRLPARAILSGYSRHDKGQQTRKLRCFFSWTTEMAFSESAEETHLEHVHS